MGYAWRWRLLRIFIVVVDNENLKLIQFIKVGIELLIIAFLPWSEVLYHGTSDENSRAHL